MCIIADMDKNENRNTLRLAVRTYYNYQDMRVRMGNRIKVKKDGTFQIIPEAQKETWDIPEKDRALFQMVYEDSLKQEFRIARFLKAELKNHSIYPWLKSVKGIGPLMAAVIISEYDIERATTVSKMWKFTGLIPGHDKLVKGEKSVFNKWLRTKMVGVLASSFIKCRAPYRSFYDNMKNRLSSEEKWKDESPGHIHRAACRYMIKMFLLDLYKEWRTIEKLEVRVPYAEEYLGKTHSI